MLDYRPHIKESKRRITSNYTNDIKENTSVTTEDILNSYSNINSNNIFKTIESINEYKIVNNNDTSNNYLVDVLQYESHVSRIHVIQEEVNVIYKTLCEMLYGEIISQSEIELINSNILDKLKSGYCDNNALYYLSKIICIAGDYLDNLDSHVRALLYSEEDIKDFVNSDSFLNDDIDALNRIMVETTNDLSDQLSTVNYISVNNVVNNYLIKIYNYMIDYCDIKSTELSSKYMVLSSINEDINETFIDIVKTMEYIKIQNELFITTINNKFNQVKNLYIK